MNKKLIISLTLVLFSIIGIYGEPVRTQSAGIVLNLANEKGEFTLGEEFDLKLSVSGIPNNGTIRVNYKVDNQNVLINSLKEGTIEAKNGETSFKVKGVNLGESTITFSNNNSTPKTYKCQIKDAPRLIIVPLQTIKIGDELILIVSNSKKDTISNVSWESSNNEIASVDDKGVVKAKKKGEAIITAKSIDASSQYGTLKLIVEKAPNNNSFWIILIFIVLILAAFFFYFKLSRFTAKIEQLKEGLAGLTVMINGDYQGKESRLKDLKVEIEEKYETKAKIEKRLKDMEEIFNKKNGAKPVEEVSKNETDDTESNNKEKEAKPNNLRYADAINNREFYNVSEQPGDLSVFELELVNSSTANFRIYPEAEKRVINRPGNLDGCEADITQGGKILQTIALGKAHEESGKWIVDSALKVKIV